MEENFPHLNIQREAPVNEKRMLVAMGVGC